MQRLVALVVVACTLAGGMGRSVMAKDPAGAQQPPGKGNAPQAKDAGIDDFVIGAPVRYKNLTVFLVSSKAPRNEDRYLTLDEGLKAGKVHVFEVGSQPTAGSAGGRARQHQNLRPTAQQVANDNPFADDQQQVADVNQLMIVNSSDKPLYIMPGEIIYGGKQDRTIGEEAIIQPGKTPVKIGVYCVESGRWAGRDAEETSVAIERLEVASSGRPSDAKARQKLAEEAKLGKFVVHAGSLNKSARAAVQEGKGQAEVWKKVGQANAASRVVTSSDAFTANYTDPKLLKQLQAYIKALQPSAANQKQVVGAIVAINGKVEAVDVFQSTPLFQKLWPKLLKSHALDAVDQVGKPGTEKTSTVSDATAFLRSAMQASVAKTSKGRGGLVVTKRDSARVMSFSAGMGGMGGGFGGSVHSSGYSK
jgi:hypothetical protein